MAPRSRTGRNGDQTFLCFSGLSDLRLGRWSEELCGALGVDMDKLPRIAASTDRIGEVCPQGRRTRAWRSARSSPPAAGTSPPGSFARARLGRPGVGQLPAGPLFPPPDPAVRGLFVGHTWAHTWMHFYRPILESISYDRFLTREIIRELLPGLELGMVTPIGSGAASQLWTQIKADALRAPYQSHERSDLSTLGAAAVGGAAAWLFREEKTLGRRFARPLAKVRPRPGVDQAYRRNIEVYRELFERLASVHRHLAGGAT